MKLLELVSLGDPEEGEGEGICTISTMVTEPFGNVLTVKGDGGICLMRWSSEREDWGE